MPHDAPSDLGLHWLPVAHKEDPGLAVVVLVHIMLYFCSDISP